MVEYKRQPDVTVAALVFMLTMGSSARIAQIVVVKPRETLDHAGVDCFCPTAPIC